MRPIGLLIPLALAGPLLGFAAPQALATDAGALTLYRDRNHGGPSMALAESNSNITFSPRSAKLTGGPWLICARPFFGGRCDEISASTGKLSLHRNFSGTVRSARPVSLPAPEKPAALPKAAQPPASSNSTMPDPEPKQAPPPKSPKD